MLASNILQIHRDCVRPGSETLYRRIEEDAARYCAEHGCPHPHLALESLAGQMEVWWLNGFASEADRQRVTDAYLANLPLMQALEDVRNQREGLLETDEDIFAVHNRELSRGNTQTVLGARFMTVTITTTADVPGGAVFETADGTRYVFAAAATREKAVTAAGQRADATVFAVRPYWGLPAREWIAADPEFWHENPAASPK